MHEHSITYNIPIENESSKGILIVYFLDDFGHCFKGDFTGHRVLVYADTRPPHEMDQSSTKAKTESSFHYMTD